jgi:hypothetical protein
VKNQKLRPISMKAIDKEIKRYRRERRSKRANG